MIKECAKRKFKNQKAAAQFFNKILAREDLFGMLLGYGENNAWFFAKVKEWQEQKKEGANDPQNNFLASLSTQSPGSNSLSSFDLFFPLPCFGCYDAEESSSLIKKYESERDAIKKIYRGKDLVQVTLDRLTSKDLSISPNRLYKEKLARELGIEQQLED